MRRSSPVIQTTSPDTQELRRERAQKLEALRRLEWEFDRHPSFDLADQTRTLRIEINDVEDHIAVLSEQVKATELLERTKAIGAQGLLDRVNKIASN